MRGFVFKRTRQRPNGKTSVRFYAVCEATPFGIGKRQREWGKGYVLRREAEAALRKRVSAFESQSFVASSRLTLANYLVDQWLPIIADRVKPTTLAAYEQMVRVYVLPRLGRLRLQDLAPGHLNHLYANLGAAGGIDRSKAGRGGTKPLSRKTVHNVHGLLSKALHDAVDSGLVMTNVAARAKPPRHRTTSATINTWTLDELNAFLAFVHGDRLYAAWDLAGNTGMRRGEVLGLRWADIDARAGSLAVRQTLTVVRNELVFSTPKSHEARVVNLDPLTVAFLKQHWLEQRAEALAFGSGYEDCGLVFRREDGRPLHPQQVSKRFDRLVRQSGLGRITFHGLRHTLATLWLKHGEPVKVVSERLGHVDPAFTLRVYQHVQDGMQAAAAARFSALLQRQPPPLQLEVRAAVKALPLAPRHQPVAGRATARSGQRAT